MHAAGILSSQAGIWSVRSAGGIHSYRGITTEYDGFGTEAYEVPICGPEGDATRAAEIQLAYNCRILARFGREYLATGL
jgi:hypothetical protein